MFKEIRKENIVFKVGVSIAGLAIIAFVVIKAEANFFIRSDMPLNLSPFAAENLDKETYSPIIELPAQPILFTEQQKVLPVNLTHDPTRPHSFKERGIPKAPTIQQLLYEILLKQGDEGYEFYLKQWVARQKDPEMKEIVKLTDRKLELIWDQAERIDLDPFYFLAILAQEGTGSFNTGGKINPNFVEDVQKAADLIKREIDEWKDFKENYPDKVKEWKEKHPGEEFDWLRWVNYGDEGDDYAGGYAEDLNWWIRVRDIYNGPRLKVKEKN